VKTAILDTPAKLNLGLRVGPRRSDGFHEIRTILQTIDLFDRLTVEPSREARDSLTVQGADGNVPESKENLVLQALSKLREYGISVPSLRIRLEKSIPTQAGLGGGSSDAAAIIRLVESEFVDGSLNQSDRHRLARELGSDVPFFLTGGTAVARGRGADYRSVGGLQARVLLALPPFSVSTEWAYDHVDPRESLETVDQWFSTEDIRSDWSKLELTNDFEPLLGSTYSTFESLMEALGRYSDTVGLSGSGSAIYALFDTERSISPIRNRLREKFPSSRFITTNFLPECKLPEEERIVSCQSK
jgi:4-diphosphocytidyl-2-C-methyl-D-erythritol kinase